MLSTFVPGGLGCGQGFPGWYTKVEYYKDWINCIIESSLRFNNNKEEVENECKRRAAPPPTCFASNEDVADCASNYKGDNTLDLRVQNPNNLRPRNGGSPYQNV